MLTEKLMTPEAKMHTRLNNLFEAVAPNWEWDFLPNLFGRSYGHTTTWMPKMDIFEKEGELILRTDLPGLLKENIKVTVEEGNYLVISGERKEEKELKEENVYRSERQFGTFYRRLPLAFKADPGLIKATYRDGILEVHVPILQETKPNAKEISIS
jgi:HSP20 family protein